MDGQQRLAAALGALDFERATSDAQRAQLLSAVLHFARSLGDESLAAAADKAIPAAHPFDPPPQWLAGFCEGFAEFADEECGTDPGNDHLSGLMLWQMSTDEWRRARVADSREQGFEDGRREAENQNKV